METEKKTEKWRKLKRNRNEIIKMETKTKRKNKNVFTKSKNDSFRKRWIRYNVINVYEILKIGSILTLWTPEDGIPTLRKLPYAARLRYTV